MCPLQDSSPAAKRHHPLVPGAYYEECDMNDDEDATFFVISHTSDISRKVWDIWVYMCD